MLVGILAVAGLPSTHADAYDLAVTRIGAGTLVALGGRDLVRVCELVPIRER